MSPHEITRNFEALHDDVELMVTEQFIISIAFRTCFLLASIKQDSWRTITVTITKIIIIVNPPVSKTEKLQHCYPI